MAKRNRLIDWINCMGKAHVYTLADPRTGEVRYVGVTTNPQQRFQFHMGAKSGTPMGDWMDKMDAAGVAPVCTVIAETCVGINRSVEREVINEHFRMGCRLLNRRDGARAKRFVAARAMAYRAG